MTSRSRLPRRLLVANRGEIACRIVRAADRLGVPTVAVFSEADVGALHTRLATQSVPIGPAPAAESYLNVERILAAAAASGADAVHPGYGFLSESPEFAEACEAAGLAFAGPTPEQIRQFGVKHTARALADAARVPVCPGSGLLTSAEQVAEAAAALRYPLLLKATAGGGGMGMVLCRDATDLREGFERATRHAATHFGDGGVFLEQRVERARHVEVQIFGDGRGAVQTLGVRDCSLQRRRQKVIEESATELLDADLRGRLEDAARRLAASVDYRSAGTVEFVVDLADRSFFFLEVNTRLQVEHTVTELVTGIDLVEWMLRLCADPAWTLPEPPDASGHAIELRVYAEDPLRDFQPCSGALSQVILPAEGTRDERTDGWIERGTVVSTFYDPLLVKLCARGADREAAIERLAGMVRATRIDGVQTNLAWAGALLEWSEFRRDRHHTRSLDDFTHAPSAVFTHAPNAVFTHAPNAVSVLEPGTLTTVQDHPGRLGYWSVGVPPSGPFDARSFQLANRIVGNAGGEAGLEVTLRGPRLRFHREGIVCVAGAPTEVRLDDTPRGLHEPIRVVPGSVLGVGEVEGPGARCYVAFRGGLDVPRYLGSRSTFVLGGFGGHGGRALAAGDVLPLGDAAAVRDPPLAPGVGAKLAPALSRQWELRVIHGPHANPEFFTDASARRFYERTYEVHHQSARTGVRLLGADPGWARRDGGDAGLHPSNIHDTAYCVGSVDFTGDMPVILGPDGPSLGGFVCPAVVVEADRWKLGQLAAGDTLRFAPITVDEASTLAAEQAVSLASRRPAIDAPARLGPDAAAIALESPVRLRRPAAQEGLRPKLEIRASGERAFLVEYGPMVLDLELRVRVQLLYEALRDARQRGDLPAIADLTPGIRSLQVQYDPTAIARRDLLRAIEAADDALPSQEDLALPARIVHLPLSWNDPEIQEAVRRYGEVVRDDAPWCPDNIAFIQRINGLDSIDAVRRVVMEASYLVLGLGDVYLGAPVATPIDPRHRLVTTKYNPARTWTPENAVGIGGAYLCVYGMEGPGGYQLFGRTVPVWNTYERWLPGASEVPWLLRFFDQIRFHPVSPEELLDLRRDLRAGLYAPRIEEDTFRIADHRRAMAEIAPEIEQFRRVQREAFAAERERWVASGEFASAAQAEQSLVAAAPELELPDLPEGSIVVRAPLGAQVLRVSVEEGSDVAEGADVAVLTAMKMETTVTAPCAGRVVRLLCKTGQLVSASSPLAVVQPRG